MDKQQWRFLLSDEGQRLLALAADPPLSDENHLRAASRLREHTDPHLAQAVIETIWLRQRARSKFSNAGAMYFTRPALEQASSEIVSTYRAQRFFEAGFERIADLGCGIGGDSLALAAKADVLGIDLDETRLAMAYENVRVYDRSGRFSARQADLETMSPLAVDALFFDPARRDDLGRRLKSVHLYRPPLSLVHLWRSETPNAAVKISPGVDYVELPADADVEFISVAGQVKEAVLWYGELRRGQGNRATLLPEGSTLTAADSPGEDIAPKAPGAYLYEPDGAVIRAHLIQQLARQMGAAQIDPTIAYLSADEWIETPFARGFILDDWFPFQLKRLRHYLRNHNVGRVTIKKRGSPLDPATLQRQLRLKGDEQRVLFLTHVLGKPAVLVGRDI